ncbi:hypothetical protein [Agromyces larvae]|uniref:HU family DNA-binding protein n=1 Tax=Agromyces larvae TaxID=2929802 RepID=A0ABY4C3B6_9MICO|nr:hypothetical protein [Agromyces larvae]UOE45968.1 hypothetical protein MTO99_09565 [Agromyces larvae]
MTDAKPAARKTARKPAAQPTAAQETTEQVTAALTEIAAAAAAAADGFTAALETAKALAENGGLGFDDLTGIDIRPNRRIVRVFGKDNSVRAATFKAPVE